MCLGLFCFDMVGDEFIWDNHCNFVDLVFVSFDIESREFNGRWYTSIRAWRVQQGDMTSAQPAAQATPQPAAPAAAPAAAPQPAPVANTQVFDASADDESGDLPF